MDSNLRNELLLVLTNENVSDNDQIRILNNCSKFVNNIKYMEKVKEKLSQVFEPHQTNFWILVPKLMSMIVEVNQSVDNINEIPEHHMKFCIYAVIVSYLEQEKPFNIVGECDGDLRVAFVNISEILLTNPMKIKVMASKCFSSCWSCCHDSSKIHL